MPKVCPVTGKKKGKGQNRSHALNATKRDFNVNFKKKKVRDLKTGKKKRMTVSARALRALDKMGVC